jgi:protoporphyrinogen oxidase
MLLDNTKGTMRIGILGGGLTGLTATSCLREENPKRIQFDVLEKDSECGGLLKSFRRGVHL